MLTGYFFFLGILALCHLLRYVVPLGASHSLMQLKMRYSLKFTTFNEFITNISRQKLVNIELHNKRRSLLLSSSLTDGSVNGRGSGFGMRHVLIDWLIGKQLNGVSMYYACTTLYVVSPGMRKAFMLQMLRVSQ